MFCGAGCLAGVGRDLWRDFVRGVAASGGDWDSDDAGSAARGRNEDGVGRRAEDGRGGSGNWSARGGGDESTVGELVIWSEAWGCGDICGSDCSVGGLRDGGVLGAGEKGDGSESDGGDR